MAKTKLEKKKQDTSPEEMDTSVDMVEEIDEHIPTEEENEPAEVVELSDIPIEKFLKDPKMSMITEENEVEESTNWCPVCSEHTIFADKVCTVCGFTKSSKKIVDDKDEESTESTFDLMPSEEVIDEMSGFGGYGDEDGRDDI